MKYFYQISLFCVLGWCISSSGFAQSMAKKAQLQKQGVTADYLLSNGTAARDFWLAIPPNEYGPGYPTRALEIYVTSSTNATITVEGPSGHLKSYKIKPFEILTLTTDSKGEGADGAKWSWELYESEVISGGAIHIFSDKPISVYELNSKSFSSDGYLALPSAVWGKDYIHLCYYDYSELDMAPNRDWGSGFIIIAKDDFTKVDIELKGVNSAGSLGRTRKGHKIGDRWSVTLQRGETYMVNGNGETRGQFDLSGSRVKSTKPIGFISFHQRTMSPVNVVNNNGRDHLAEYLPPVSAWGKKYIAVEFQRENRGDLYRIIASQDNTKYECKYYDKTSGQLIGKRSGFLKKAGDFGEYDEFVFDALNLPNPRPEGIKGMCIWTADKPVLVMQYAYSASFDTSPLYDPTMVWTVPVEQYTLGTVFETPANAAFVNNYFNLLVVGDSADPTFAKLKSVEMAHNGGDWKPVWKEDPTFLFHRIPTTNIWWATMKVLVGTHRVKAETPFGGVIYGFNEHDGYSWPAATAVNKIDELDTLPPVLTFTHTCAEWTYGATEFRNGAPTDSIRQIDQGINQIVIDENRSYNFSLELPKELVPDKPEYGKFAFVLKVKDILQDGFVVFSVIDRAGNVAIDSIRYIAEVIAMHPPQISFGNVRLGASKQMTAYLVNPTNKDLTVDSLWLLVGKEFTVVPPIPKSLAAHDSALITFMYTPSKEWDKNPKTLDIDSVFARGKCDKYPLGELTGRGVMPHIIVEDIDMGLVKIKETVCNTNDTYTKTLRVENIGTDTLTMTGIGTVNAPFTFTFTDPPPATWPIRIIPGGIVYFKTICYTPTNEQRDTIQVVFNSDAPKTDDNISQWTGEGIRPGPRITRVDWGSRRVGTINDSVVFIYNTGSSSVRIKNVSLFPADGEGNMSMNNTMISLKGGALIGVNEPIDLSPGDSLQVNVHFIPTDENIRHHARVLARYDEKFDTIPGGDLYGQGFLPKIHTEGHDFACQDQGKKSDEKGYLTMTNPSTSASLRIFNITPSDPGNPPSPPGTFQLDLQNALPAPVTFPLNIAQGDSIKIPILFTAVAPPPGGAQMRVDIESDATTGPNPEPRIHTVENRITGKTCPVVNLAATASNWSFGTVLLCDAPLGQIKVYNPNPQAINVDSVQWMQNAGLFTLVNAPAFPLAIPAMDSLVLTVRYTPAEVSKDDHDTLLIFNDVKTGLYSWVNGTGRNVDLTFRISDDSKYYLPGQKMDVPFTIENKNEREAAVTSFELRVKYDPQLLRYNGKKQDIPGWNIVVEADPKDLGTGMIRITGSGTDLLQNNATFTLGFDWYLTDQSKTPLLLDSAALGQNREVCVHVEKFGNERLIGEFCSKDGRVVKYLGLTSLKQNIPNPVKTETEIEYSIVLSADTKLAIYNSMGDEVKVLVSGRREPGVYHVKLNASDLPSGSYSYRLISGSHIETQEMIIAR